MVIINNTLHLIFVNGVKINIGTNVFEKNKEPKFDNFSRTAFIDSGELTIVNEKDNSQFMQAVNHSLNKDVLQDVVKQTKSKSIKAAAEKKATELSEIDKKIAQEIEKAKSKKSGNF